MWRNENSPTPGRNTNFTKDELYTLMNLWCIARSPLIIGSDMPSMDDFTLKLLTNDEVLKVNQYSANNRQLKKDGDAIVWIADAEGSKDKYVALFNAPAAPARGRRGATTAPAAPTPSNLKVGVKIAELAQSAKVANIRDLWSHKDLGAKDEVTADLAPHASAIYKIEFAK